MAEHPTIDQIDAIVADPNWLPYRIRDDSRTLELVRLSRGQLKDLFFLDKRSHPDRWSKVSREAPGVKMPVAAIVDSARAANFGPLPLHLPFSVLLFDLNVAGARY